ncbi:Hypothetical predicted protein [Mytilus galloprovincialis]|uniref:Uncharacterized protein n=1 Tax=Mytilus galloprovincialis TaxID=29158 RepID=A0A8B6EHX3_MYTGA|nr:Hypothetical predicted protein [Mytilus galloprovincialis]
MDTRLAIAKAREGLAYALQTEGNIPPFCRINLSCRPDVSSKTIYRELQEMWITKESAISANLLTETIEFFDAKLAQVTGEIKKTLDNAKEIIGIASQSAGEARKELHKRFIEMKDNQEKTLLEFKTNIRSRTNNYRGRNGKRVPAERILEEADLIREQKHFSIPNDKIQLHIFLDLCFDER